MKAVNRKLNLDQPLIYQIKVSGRLDDHLSDWAEGMTITVEPQEDGPPITTLTGILVDQAALQGTLRRLYSLGTPLISVNRVDPE